MPRLTRAERQAKRNQQGATDVPVWTPDDAEPTYTRWTTDNIDNTTRITDRVVRYYSNDQMVQFAVVLDAYIDGDWHETLCIDTCHGTVHRHRDGDHVSEPENIGPLDPDDIEGRHWDAISEAYDQWNARENR